MSDKYPAGPVTAPSSDDRDGLAAKLSLRLAAAELAAVRRRARALGVKPSAWVRAVVRDALDARRGDVERLHGAAARRPDPEIAAAVEQLRRVGVNLNQERRAVAADGGRVSGTALGETLAAVDSLRAALGDRVAL